MLLLNSINGQKWNWQNGFIPVLRFLKGFTEDMELLERAILEKGKVLPGNVLKVGSFLNNQIDVRLSVEMGKAIFSHFANCGVNKILTVESSGIGLACITAQFFDCTVVFAKKKQNRKRRRQRLHGRVLFLHPQGYEHPASA